MKIAILLLYLSIAFCIASGDAQLWVPQERITTDDYDGLILKSNNKAVLSWKLTKGDVIDFEKQLAMEFHRSDDSKPMAGYKRYYRGVLTSNGSRQIYVDFVSPCSQLIKNDQWLKSFSFKESSPTIYDFNLKRFIESFSLE